MATNSIVTKVCPAGHPVYVTRAQRGATCFKCSPPVHFEIQKEGNGKAK